MFANLMNRLFGRRDDDGPQPERIVERVTALSDGLPGGKMLCVFQRGRLVNYHETDAPAALGNGEVGWLVPRDDAAFDLETELGEQVVRTCATVRFEPESELLQLLNEREFLTRDDIAALLTSQLAGLLELEGHENAASLESLGDFERERLRAKLSLLLQTRGLRCTDLAAFEAVQMQIEPSRGVSPRTGPTRPG
ncbi:MAG: hypothetical protein ACREJB_12630, partial [Planctomycetaceae bacterium]